MASSSAGSSPAVAGDPQFGNVAGGSGSGSPQTNSFEPCSTEASAPAFLRTSNVVTSSRDRFSEEDRDMEALAIEELQGSSRSVSLSTPTRANPLLREDKELGIKRGGPRRDGDESKDDSGALLAGRRVDGVPVECGGGSTATSMQQANNRESGPFTFSATTAVVLFVLFVTVTCSVVMFVPPLVASVEEVKINLEAQKEATRKAINDRMGQWFSESAAIVHFTARMLEVKGGSLRNLADNTTLLSHFCHSLDVATPAVGKIYAADNLKNVLVGCRRDEGPAKLAAILVENDTARRFSLLKLSTASHSYELESESLHELPFSFSSRPWYISTVEGNRSTWGEVYVDFASEDPAYTFSTPVRNETGGIVGVVAVDLSTVLLNLTLHDLIPSGGLVVIFDGRTGGVVGTSENIGVVDAEENSTTGGMKTVGMMRNELPLLDRALVAMHSPTPEKENGTWSFGNMLTDRKSCFVSDLNIAETKLRFLLVMPDGDFNDQLKVNYLICFIFFWLAVLFYPIAAAVGMKTFFSEPLEDLRGQLRRLECLNLEPPKPSTPEQNTDDMKVAPDVAFGKEPESPASHPSTSSRDTSSTTRRCEEIHELDSSVKNIRSVLAELRAFVPVAVWDQCRVARSASLRSVNSPNHPLSMRSGSGSGGIAADIENEDDLESIDSSEMSDTEYESNVLHAIQDPLRTAKQGTPSSASEGGRSGQSITVASVSSSSRHVTSRPPLSLLKRQISKHHVTMMVVNVRNFSSACLRLSEHKVATFQARIVEFVNRCVVSHKGNIDYFYGDHFLCSFNAASHVVSHKKQAVLCALNLRDQVELFWKEIQQEGWFDEQRTPTSTTPVPPRNSSPVSAATSSVFGPTLSMRREDNKLSLSCGIASGKAIVGNFGPEQMLRFCCIGDCVGHAFQLERACNHTMRALAGLPTPTPIPVDSAHTGAAADNPKNRFNIFTLDTMIPEITAEVYFQCVELITLFPQSKRQHYQGGLLRADSTAVFADPPNTSLSANPSFSTMSIVSSVSLSTCSPRAVPFKMRDQIVICPMDVAVADGSGNDEWMYRLQRKEENDPYQHVNKAFAEGIFGDTKKGHQLLAKQPEREEMHSAYRLQGYMKYRERQGGNVRSTSGSTASADSNLSNSSVISTPTAAKRVVSSLGS